MPRLLRVVGLRTNLRFMAGPKLPIKVSWIHLWANLEWDLGDIFNWTKLTFHVQYTSESYARTTWKLIALVAHDRKQKTGFARIRQQGARESRAEWLSGSAAVTDRYKMP